jgi:hypothetical protein
MARSNREKKTPKANAKKTAAVAFTTAVSTFNPARAGAKRS